MKDPFIEFHEVFKQVVGRYPKNRKYLNFILNSFVLQATRTPIPKRKQALVNALMKYEGLTFEQAKRVVEKFLQDRHLVYY